MTKKRPDTKNTSASPRGPSDGSQPSENAWRRALRYAWILAPTDEVLRLQTALEARIRAISTSRNPATTPEPEVEVELRDLIASIQGSLTRSEGDPDAQADLEAAVRQLHIRAIFHLEEAFFSTSADLPAELAEKAAAVVQNSITAIERRLDEFEGHRMRLGSSSPDSTGPDSSGSLPLRIRAFCRGALMRHRVTPSSQRLRSEGSEATTPGSLAERA